MLTCVIIDDEPLAQNVLKKFIGRVSALKLVHTFDNAIDGFNKLPILKPDIVFLDIGMPEMTGLEFLAAYPNPKPNIILTTAHPEYALDGFEHSVNDYLLKPFSFERFLKSINKVNVQINVNSASLFSKEESLINNSLLEDVSLPNSNSTFIYVKTSKEFEQIQLDEIVFIEGMRDYVKIVLEKRFLITHATMTRFENILPSSRFIRINRSYIVQLSYVKSLSGNIVTTSSGHHLTIGPIYKEKAKKSILRWLIN